MKSGYCALLVLSLLAGACQRGARPPLSQDEFVTTMVELRRAVPEGEDTLFGDRRHEILERRGVTEEELHAYVRWAARDPALLRETFNRITEQVREPLEQ